MQKIGKYPWGDTFKKNLKSLILDLFQHTLELQATTEYFTQKII